MRSPAALLVALAALALAFVAAPVQGAGKISLQLTQALGTEAGAGAQTFDPSLEPFKSQLEKYRYRNFKNVGNEKKDCGEGEAVTFSLNEPGYQLTATPKGSGNMIALDLSMKDGKGKEVVKTTLKIKDGGTAMVNKELDGKPACLFLFFAAKRN